MSEKRLDRLERMVEDLVRRVQELETERQYRADADRRTRFPALERTGEHPGRSLGIGSHERKA